MPAELRALAAHHFGAHDRCWRTSCERTWPTPLHTATHWSKVSAMLNPKIIDDLARRLSNTVPAGLREAQQDLEKNFRTVLQNTLAKLDLVTREEFDVQSRLLSRTREKLEALEKTIAELEARQPRD